MTNTRNKKSVSARKPVTGRVQKKDIILKAARKIFLEQGYASATTDMIQAAAGVSKSTLYAHFPTKKILFEAVCRMRSEDFETVMRDAVAGTQNPRDYLCRYGIAFLGSLLSRDGLAFYRLMVAGARRFRGLGATFYSAGIKASSDMIETYLREANKNGSLRVPHPVISTEHFLGMLRGEMHMRAVLNVGRPPNAAQQRNHVIMTVDHFLSAHLAAAEAMGTRSPSQKSETRAVAYSE